MDYHRIYREFIADRKAKPTPGGYTERHHIVPRYMGGSDEAENLIALTPEDHFFAHLCWAMAEGTMQAWAAVMIMHERGSRCDLFKRRTRETYGWTRRRYGKICKEGLLGENNPNHNPEIITLKRANGRLASKTRLEWFRSGVPHAQICGLLNGKSGSYRGWMLPDRDPATVGRSYAGSLRRNVKVYSWVHLDGRRRKVNNHQLAEEFGLRVDDLNSIVRGEHGMCRGWSIEGTAVGWPCGRTAFKCEKVNHLVHIDGPTAEGTQSHLILTLGIDQRQISALVTGKRKSCQGWMLKDVAATGYRPRLWRSPSGEAQGA